MGTYAGQVGLNDGFEDKWFVRVNLEDRDRKEAIIAGATTNMHEPKLLKENSLSHGRIHL